MPQPPGAFTCSTFQGSGPKSLPATIAHKGFSTAFQPVGGVYGCHLAYPRGTTAFTRATRASCVGLRFETRCTAISRSDLAEKSAPDFQFPETFGKRWCCPRELLFDYSVVDFSKPFFKKHTFSKHSHFVEEPLFCCYVSC